MTRQLAIFYLLFILPLAFTDISDVGDLGKKVRRKKDVKKQKCLKSPQDRDGSTEAPPFAIILIPLPDVLN